jgi:hypothetical protein
MRHISAVGVRKHKAVERPFAASCVGVGGCCNLILHYLEWQFDRVPCNQLEWLISAWFVCCRREPGRSAAIRQTAPVHRGQPWRGRPTHLHAAPQKGPLLVAKGWQGQSIISFLDFVWLLFALYGERGLVKRAILIKVLIGYVSKQTNIISLHMVKRHFWELLDVSDFSITNWTKFSAQSFIFIVNTCCC